MIDQVPEFIAELRRQPDFDAAASATLRRTLAVAGRALAESAHARSARLLRGLVHLRPEGGYRSLVVLEGSADEAHDTGERASFLPSATAWRWVEAERRAIAIDVHLGALCRVGGGPAGNAVPMEPFESEGSILRLIERDATHILVVPLLGPSTRVFGMVSIEVACKRAIGEPFVWSACADDLQLLADVATPYLLGLPLRAREDEATDELLPVVGRSMSRTIALLRSFAAQDETILVQGPTGAGKSRLARWAHAHSPRRDGPFEILDLASFPEEMQLAELFGWRKGAFTGAMRDHEGAVARAEGGTLFIDEIGNLAPKAQAGLLHLLEERGYRPLGDEGTARPANVRFVVATNVDLATAVSNGSFREDLFYRINVLPVRLPPLSERADEIAPWSRFMIARAGGSVRGELSAAATAALAGRPWPGNLRELDNVLRRVFAIARGESEPGAEVVVVDERHVRLAATLDAGGDLGAITAMTVAAAAFVEDADRLRERGTALDLEASDAFPGMVLLAAARRFGSVEEAFRRLGREELVAGRNHHKAFRRALARVAALYEILGCEPSEDLRRTLGDR